jgi:hypothetical protein
MSNDTSQPSKPARVSGGTVVLFALFGIYLLACAFSAFSTGKWPIFMPVQLDAVGFLLGAGGSPFGVYAGATITLLLGIGACWLAFAVWRRREV